MTPSWVAARPMPSAWSISRSIRRTSSLERRVEHLDLARAAAQHRVAVLAHVAQRGVAARAGLGIELPPLLGLLFLCGDLFLGHRAVESRD